MISWDWTKNNGDTVRYNRIYPPRVFWSDEGSARSPVVAMGVNTSRHGHPWRLDDDWGYPHRLGSAHFCMISSLWSTFSDALLWCFTVWHDDIFWLFDMAGWKILELFRWRFIFGNIIDLNDGFSIATLNSHRVLVYCMNNWMGRNKSYTT